MLHKQWGFSSIFYYKPALVLAERQSKVSLYVANGTLPLLPLIDRPLLTMILLSYQFELIDAMTQKAYIPEAIVYLHFSKKSSTQ
jgi:hypothetical protein